MDEQQFLAVKASIVNRAVTQAMRESRRRRQWMATQVAEAQAVRRAMVAGDYDALEFSPGTRSVRLRNRPGS